MKKNKKKLEILKRLCLIIDEANVSQAGIARALGTSPALISRWKKGDITPSIESYEKLCKFLKYDVDWLLTGENYSLNKSYKKLSENLILGEETIVSLGEEAIVMKKELLDLQRKYISVLEQNVQLKDTLDSLRTVERKVR